MMPQTELPFLLAFISQLVAQENRQHGPVFVEEPSDVMYSVESTERKVVFNCQAQGSPPPTYRWMRNGTEVSVGGRYGVVSGGLVISHPAEGKDAGTYYCLASNAVGTVRSREAALQFAYLESFRTKHRGTVAVRQGQGVVLICAPPPHSAELAFDWVFNDFPITVQSDGRRFVSQATGNLYIAKVENSDVGSYTCAVTNTVTSTRALSPATPLVLKSGGIMGEYEPRIEVSFPSKTHVLRGDMARLECFALGNPVPRISWRKIDGDLPTKVVLSKSNAVLEIPNVQPEDTGSYECKAANSAGKNTAQGKITVYAPPQWLEPISDVEQGLGDTLQWECKATGKPQPAYKWMKDGVLVGAEGRVRVLESGDLIVGNVKPSDRGMFQCIAENKHGRIYSSAELRVKASLPDFKNNPVPRITPAARGGQAVIKCEPRAWPKPTFSWTKGNVLVRIGERISILDNGSLWIERVLEGDEGGYTCTAENQLGKASSTGYLDLKESTRITVPPLPKMVTVGQSAVMPCRAAHDPSLDIMFLWSLNGQPIELDKTSDHYHRSEVWQKQNFGDLTIKKIQLRHGGNYTCWAQTVVDQAVATAELMVRGPPGPPEGVLADDVTDTTVVLSWSPGLNNHSPITAYKVRGRTPFTADWQDVKTDPENIAGDSEMVMVVGLTPWMDYEFQTIATNLLGDSDPSAPSRRVRTLASAPRTPPSNIGGGGGHAHELVITWTPVERTHRYGPDFGYIVAFRENGTMPWRKVTIPLAESSRYIYRNESTKPYTAFQVQIRAYNMNGESAFSDITIVHSAENEPNVPPSSVTARSLSSKEVEVMWRPVPLNASLERVQGYEIVFWKSGEREDTAERIRVAGSDTAARISGLKCNTQYEVAAHAYNSAGVGPPSEVTTVTTKKSPPSRPPSGLQLRRDGGRVTLDWENVVAREDESAVTGYRITYHSLEGTTLKEIVTNQTYVELTFPDSETYVIQVRAHSEDGEGPASPQLRIRTNPDANAGNSSTSKRGPSLPAHVLFIILAIVLATQGSLP
ncbi:contactin-4-like [Lampetra fluviatilis]